MTGVEGLQTLLLADEPHLHGVTVGDQRIDPYEPVGEVPDRPAAYWGWGSLPDQYGRRFDEDDGETPVPPDPRGSDLRAIRYDWGPRPRA